jgi:hypothetical protein
MSAVLRTLQPTAACVWRLGAAERCGSWGTLVRVRDALLGLANLCRPTTPATAVPVTIFMRSRVLGYL